MKKKDEGRFTIRLNSKTPKQRIVMDFMNTLGRQVAPFIAEAGYEYLVKYGYLEESTHDLNGSQKFIYNPNPAQTNVNQAHGVNIVPSLTKSISDNVDESNKLHLPDTTHTEDYISNPSNDESFDDEARQNILGSLNMFNN